MGYRYTIEAETGSKTDQVSAGQENRDIGKDKSLAAAKQGQLITGTVVSADEQVTLDFDGQEVVTDNSVLTNARPGDVKTFEVVKATASEIELKLIEEDLGSVKTIMAVRVDTADLDILMDRKDKTVQKAEQETQYQDIKSKLAQISATFTEQDYQLLEKEGFPVESFTVDGLTEALDRVKTNGLEPAGDRDKTDSAPQAERSLARNVSKINVYKENMASQSTAYVSTAQGKRALDSYTASAVGSTSNVQPLHTKAAVSAGEAQHQKIPDSKEGDSSDTAQNTGTSDHRLTASSDTTRNNRTEVVSSTTYDDGAQGVGTEHEVTVSADAIQYKRPSDNQTAQVSDLAQDTVSVDKKTLSPEDVNRYIRTSDSKREASAHTVQNGRPADRRIAAYADTLQYMKASGYRAANTFGAAQNTKPLESTVAAPTETVPDRKEIDAKGTAYVSALPYEKAEKNRTVVSEGITQAAESRSDRSIVSTGTAQVATTSDRRTAAAVNANQDKKVSDSKIITPIASAQPRKIPDGDRAVPDNTAQRIQSEEASHAAAEYADTQQNIRTSDKNIDAILASKLTQARLPVTEENLSQLSQALTLGELAGSIDDKTMKYLISTNAEPTASNIYKAYYSKSNQGNTGLQELSETAWKQLENQVKTVITEAGYEANEQNLADAKWLIENKLPLTTQTFTYKKQLESVKSDTGRDELLSKLLEGMQKGTNPKDVPLITAADTSAKQIIAKVNSVHDGTITKAVQQKCELTIKNLLSLQADIKETAAESSETAAMEAKAEDYLVKTAAAITKAAENITKIAGEATDTALDIKTAAAALESVNETHVPELKKAADSMELVSSDITKMAREIIHTTGRMTGKSAEVSEKAENSKADTNTKEQVQASSQAARKEEAGIINNTRLPHMASEIIKTATGITKKSIELADHAAEVTEAAADKTNTELSNTALHITKAAVDITREISDITKSAMKLIDVTQDIEKPVTNLVQTASDGPVQEEIKAYDAEDGQDNPEKAPAEATDDQYEELKARRQLEEIRLKLTLEAAGRLEKKGIQVETEKLSKVVDALREQEEDYYKKLLREADAPVSRDSVQTLKETTQSIEKLRYIPISALGSTLSIRDSQTITGLVTEGSRLEAEYTKAGTAYETLATVPNREYGDSLKKAFANADSLLRQLELDGTEANKRAVRILGYNQMEVTTDSISQVKAYDRQVTDLVKNLHPAVTVRMIKEGINPLNMPVEELNQTIDRMKEEQGISSEDKYSTYLRNLEKQEGITEEERKAYIGIYRLLYNVEKSDGAVVGAVIKADREVTLGNLLTAIQTRQKGSMNAAINDEFGILESISKKGESIASQLSPFSSGSEPALRELSSSDRQHTGEQTLASAPEEAKVKEQMQYMHRVLKQIKEELSPARLSEAGTALSLNAASQEQTTASADRTAAKGGIWEQLKTVPVEKLMEQLQNTGAAEAADHEAYAAKAQEIRELCKNAEQSIRFLSDYRMPATPLNILMANSLLTNGESPVKKLLKLKNENQVENSENGLKEINNLSDTLVDKNSMQEAYKALETDTKQILEEACSREILDSRRLAELKGMSQQMTFIRTLASREFYQIPIETDTGITNMNLTIIHGEKDTGKVSVNIWSQQLGNIKAEFSLKDRMLKGYFSSDDKNGLKQLKENTAMVEAAAKDCNISIKQMDFGLQQRENESYSYQNPGKEGASASKDTERMLYRIAKAVVLTVRSAENGGKEQNKAVS